MKGITLKVGPFSASLRAIQPEVAVKLSDDGATYARSIKSLAQMLHGLPWYLVGGLAIPVTLGCFYRLHSDIDIAAEVEELGPITSAMERYGYKLYGSIYSQHSSVRLSLQWPTNPNAIRCKKQIQRLFFKRRRRDNEDGFLSMIDIFPYRDNGDFIENLTGRPRLVKSHQDRVGVYVSFEEYEIPCFELSHIKALKLGSCSLKDRLDLAVIEKGVVAAKELASSHQLI